MPNANLFVRGLNTTGTAPTASQVRVRELVVDQSTGTFYTQKTDGTVRVVNPPLGYPFQVIVVDCGSIPVAAANFFVPVQGLQSGMNLFCAISGYNQSGAFADEMEMEPMTVAAQVVTTGLGFFSVSCCESTMLTVGKKTITFYAG